MVMALLQSRLRSWNREVDDNWIEKKIDGDGDQKIVQIFLDGPIKYEAGNNQKTIISQLDKAIIDPLVKGVVLSVNSPGGDVVYSEEIYRKIVEVKKSGKRVVISMGQVAASGGYYISAPADKIFASPSTITGSIGVVMSIPNFKGLADKIGYKEITITSGTYKDMGNPLSNFTEQSEQIYKKLIGESYERFVDIIVEGRKLKREEVLKLADGRIYSGIQAKKLRLIDEFGNLEDATNDVKKKLGMADVQIIRYNEDPSFLSEWSKWLHISARLVAHTVPLEEQIKTTAAQLFDATPQILYMLK